MAQRTALLVVDLQIDFLPGGALAVADGDALVEPIGELMSSGRFDVIVATQDWHPAGHVSFASAHAGRAPFESVTLYDHPQTLWPDHCIAGSAGAELAAGLPWERAHAIIRKGTDPKVDSYSAFRNNWDRRGQRPPTGLAGYLTECGVTRVSVCGLARDYCVLWTAEDAADLGYQTRFLWSLTRPVKPADDAATRAALTSGGIEISD